MNVRSRCRGMAAALLAAAAALASGAVTLNRDDVEVRIDIHAGRREAVASCTAYRRFVAAARANATNSEVFERLDESMTPARRAVDADPHWVRLVSGIESIRLGLERDDAESARLGRDLVREMCAEAGVEV